jgi:hypothetical protein
MFINFYGKTVCNIVCGVLQSKSDTGHDDVAGVLMGVVMV